MIQLARTCSPHQFALFTEVLEQWDARRVPDLEHVLQQRAVAHVTLLGAGGNEKMGLLGAGGNEKMGLLGAGGNEKMGLLGSGGN